MPRFPSTASGRLGSVAACGLIALLVMASAAVASDFPNEVDYQTPILDREGRPLSGTYDLALSYFRGDGELLFSEDLEKVKITNGRLEVVLGSGRARQPRTPHVRRISGGSRHGLHRLAGAPDALTR